MDKIIITIVSDIYHEADALRDIANVIENIENDEELDGMKFENKHYAAIINELRLN